MTGLEKIIKHIEEDASTAAETVILQAKDKADQTITNAHTEGDKMSAEIAEKSQLDVNAFLNRAESTAALQKKKMILNAKQQIISEIMQKAKTLLMELPEDEYFEAILKMLQKYALGMSGEILFSEKDRKRIPNQFAERVNSALVDVPGASLTVSDHTRAIDGGFVLIYGDIEENCSFEALILADKDALQDKISTLLFEQHTA